MEINITDEQVERMLCLYDYSTDEAEHDHFYSRFRKAVFHYQGGKRVYTGLQEWIDSHLGSSEADSGEDRDRHPDIRRDEEVPEQKETELPDWCRPDEWVYDIHTKRYDKITEIQDHRVVLNRAERAIYTDSYINGGNVVQARLRPYNAAEMRQLVGKIICTDTLDRLVVTYDKSDDTVFVGGAYWISKDELLNNCTIDGKPCGVLEHLNENGEWVQ